nr:hypothetical protein [Acinetobacter sp. YH01006]
MGEQGFNALRHANCCRIAYEGGQESMKMRIDELQETNLNLEGECVQLQKRLDAVKAIMNEYYTGSYEESAEMAGLISAALEGDHAT